MLGYVKVPRIEESFDLRNLLPSTALDPNILFEVTLYLYPPTQRKVVCLKTAPFIILSYLQYEDTYI